MRSKRRRNWIYLALAVFGSSLLIGVWTAWVLIAWLQIQSSSATDKEKFDASLEVAKAIVTAVGTAATIVGAYVLYRNFKVANRQAEIANRNTEIAERSTRLAEERLRQDMGQAAETAKLNQSRLITDRFSKAVEQLGNEKLAVRLGGIYALEKIALDSPEEYHWTIIEVLTSFLRERLLVREIQGEPLTLAEDSPTKQESSIFNKLISESSLPSLDTDVQAVLTVIGRRETNNDGTKKLDLNRIDLSGAILDGAKFSKAILIGTIFDGAKLNGAILNEAVLDWASFNGATLNEADLNEAKLKGADLRMAYASYVDLRNAVLIFANLTGSALNGTKFNEANLVGAKLDRAGLTSADFRGAILNNASFTDADLRKANLTKANFTNANFTKAKLTLEQVRSASGESWRRAIFDEKLRQQLDLPFDYDAEIRKEWGLPPRERKK